MSDRALYKSSHAEALDAYYSGSPDDRRSAYEYALDLLQGQGSLSAVIAKLERDGRGPRDAKPAPKDSPLAGKHVDEVIQRGYTQAIQLALGHDDPAPIETLWMTGASDEFEIHVCDGERLVTVLWLIPVVRPYGSERARSTSWMISAGAPAVQRSGPRAGPRPGGVGR